MTPAATTAGSRRPARTPAEPGDRSRALVWLDDHRWAVYLLLAAVTAVLYLVNLTYAPDFTIDDTFYTHAAQNVLTHGSISWGSDPIFVHPPVFFLTLAGWLGLLGKAHADQLDAEHAARYLNAFLVIGVVLLSASTARALSRRPGGRRALVMLGVGLLVATCPFLVKFGRSVLIEPEALLAGLLVTRCALVWRGRSAVFYVSALGVVEGIALLVKEPTLFLVLAPLVVSILEWNRRRVLLDLGAIAVAVVVFLSWVVGLLVQGEGGGLYDTSSRSVKRLLGIIQDTGLNRKGVSPVANFTQTFAEYVAGYVLLAAGGIALVMTIWHHRRTLRTDLRIRFVVGFGLVCYFFVFYSLAVGAANQQLTVYGVPAAAFALLIGWNRPPAATRAGADPITRSVAPVLLQVGATAVALVLALISWFAYFAVNPHDDATVKVEAFLSTQTPVCAPVNATGDDFRWEATLRTHPVVTYLDGPSGIAAGVHIWLLSPKDAEFYYGSSPELADWIRSHGYQVFSTKSTSFRQLEVWYVGDPTTPVGQTAPSCANDIQPAALHSSPSVFVVCFVVDLLLVLGGAYAVRAAGRRREVV